MLTVSRFEDRGVSFWQMYRWRKAYAGGDLDRGLYPREASDVSQNLAEIKRLHRLLEQERQAHEKTRAQVAKYEATVESLGKAIELLHAHSGVGQALEKQPVNREDSMSSSSQKTR